jgi:hypothetical protein
MFAFQSVHGVWRLEGVYLKALEYGEDPVNSVFTRESRISLPI